MLTQQANTSNVYIVNGYVDKCDGNFIGQFFFQQLTNTNLFIGNYPCNLEEVIKLSQEGITGVLNLQTDDDILSRQINQDQLIDIYQECNMDSVINVPVNDCYEELFEQQLIDAAIELHKMATIQQLKVFVHCTTGYNRAPAVMIAYLCLFMQHPDWQDVDAVAKWLKDQYSASYPNLRMVKMAIEHHRHLTKEENERLKQEEDEKLKRSQEEIMRLQAEEIRKRMRQAEEERQRKLKLKMLEEERLRQVREKEMAEQEKLRKQQEAEAEKERLKRQKEEEEEREKQRQ